MATATSDDIGPQIRTIQIIAGALVAGVLVFLAVAFFVVRAGRPLSAEPWQLDAKSILTVFSLAFAGVQLVGSAFIPNLLADQARRRLVEGGPKERSSGASGLSSATQALAAVFTTRMIVAFALLEGAALFAGIAYIIEGKAPALLVALGLLFVMAARFPTRGRVEAWGEGQRQLMAE